MEQIFISIPLEKFEEVIKASVSEVLNANIEKDTQDSEKAYLTRQQTAKLLHISLTTLDTYTREEIIKGYKMGHRVLYKKSDIGDALLEKIKSVKFKSK